MFKILISDPLPQQIIEKYRSEDGVEIHLNTKILAEQLKEKISGYDGLVVRSQTRVTADVIAHADRLKIIGRAGAGVDNVDIMAATKNGIIVMNTPGGNTIAATEHTIGLILAALRNIPQANISLSSKKWDRKSYIGKELFEKSVGIVGFGKIGQEVAKRLSAFETRILVYDPIMTTELAERFGVSLVSFEELLNKSDIITIHVPKIPQTSNLFNKKAFNLCKDGVVLVNCARGGIVNEEDLIEALNSCKVSIAANDVFEKEPPENWRIIDHPHCISTPHLGASTEEAQTKVADQILKQMIKYFKAGVAEHAINFISVDENLQAIISPYFELANRLGFLFSSIKETRLNEVSIRFYGDVISLPVEPIVAHLMTGTLQSSEKELAKNVDLINPVNALSLAKEKGIKVEITKRDHPLTSHTNLIECEFNTENTSIFLAGTVYAQNIYRLINFKGYNVDAELSGQLVIVENEDVPGIIGKVGTILGENNINIIQVSSGRESKNRKAANIFNIEGYLSADVKNCLDKIQNIINVFFIEMKN
jgi:D-3-phosphoglycerate dehydrogenase